MRILPADAPRSTRIAVANLYLRKRDAQRQSADTRRKHGCEHMAFILAEARASELHNTLISVTRAVWNELDPDETTYRLSTNAWKGLVARRGHALNRLAA